MASPLSLRQNQDKVKCLKFPGVHPTSALSVSLASAFPFQWPLTASSEDVLPGRLSARGISGLTQDRKNLKSPESLTSRGHLSESAVMQERSICKTGSVAELAPADGTKAADSSEGHLYPSPPLPGKSILFPSCPALIPKSSLVPPLGSRWPLSEKAGPGTLLLNSSCAGKEQPSLSSLLPPSLPTFQSSSGSSVHGTSQARILRLGCHFLLQGILPNQGLNLHCLHLLHEQVGSFLLVPRGTPTSDGNFGLPALWWLCRAFLTLRNGLGPLLCTYCSCCSSREFPLNACISVCEFPVVALSNCHKIVA